MPADVLVPALFGVRNLDNRLPKGIALGLGALGLTAASALARRRESRPLVLGALAMIVGGYALTYAVRSAPNPHWVLEVQRYHLFPQAGLALLIAAALRPWRGWLDAKPTRTLAFATAVAALLWVAHHDEMKGAGGSSAIPSKAAPSPRSTAWPRPVAPAGSPASRRSRPSTRS